MPDERGKADSLPAPTVAGIMKKMQYTSVNRRIACEPVARGMGQAACVVKRVSDVLLSALGMILLSPLFLAVYVALKLQGDGPVIYRQERIGKDGKPFDILKFRTMTVDAEADGPRLEEADDPRVTKVGAWLRLHHLDELPQLWNVFVGDMSLVGYRPEREYFIRQIMEHDARYACLYQMRPGITSDATLYNGYTNSMEKMLERLNMDLHYLETGTPWTDVKIMLRTVWLIISGGKTL